MRSHDRQDVVTPPAAHAAGDLVAGCRLLAPLGGGERSQAWLAVERTDAVRVVVKLYAQGCVPTGDRLRVRHPHVIAVRRVVDTPPATVLQLAEGGSVAGLVAARGRLDPGEVATLVAGVGAALVALHGAGLVHGDVTAGNVLFAADGRPLLSDLADLRVAGSGPRVATAGFAAPEVETGEAPGPPCDVHGLSAVAWFALTGAPPGPASQRLPLTLLRPEAPTALAACLADGLAPDPSSRPPVDELVAAVMAAVPAAPVRLVPGAMPALPRAESATHRIDRGTSVPPADVRCPPRHRAHEDPPGGRRAVRRLVLLGCAVSGLALGALIAAGAVDRAGAQAGQGRPRPVPPATAPVTPSQQSDDPTEVVSTLLADRTAALRSGDRTGLDAVYVARSPALAADAGLVEASGPLDVRYEAGPVTVLESGADAMTVDVVVRITAGDGDGAAGAAVVEGDGRVVLDLVRTGEGWRIAAVSGR